MEITVMQAILIGIACWLGSVENCQPLGTNLQMHYQNQS